MKVHSRMVGDFLLLHMDIALKINKRIGKVFLVRSFNATLIVRKKKD